jgi:hypothetical protein
MKKKIVRVTISWYQRELHAASTADLRKQQRDLQLSGRLDKKEKKKKKESRRSRPPPLLNVLRFSRTRLSITIHKSYPEYTKKPSNYSKDLMKLQASIPF